MTRIEKIKDEILGKDYELSLVFVSENKIKSLNKKYRKINKPTDVLSFSISENLGEIFICKKIAKAKAPKFDMTFANYLLFLVIHAILHLSGLNHGNKMEKLENLYNKKFKTNQLPKNLFKNNI